MKLLVVESPAKARTISKYLAGQYLVKASIGHIRDLPKSNQNAIDLEAGFVPRYEIIKGKERIVSELKSLAKKADEVLLATDPDREGEAIAWHIAQAVGLKNPGRIVFNEITKTAVQEAIKHPRKIDQNLKTAQEARRVLDRLFGYDLSGLIWKKLRYGLSAGRVQSPALRILVEREREIRSFKPEKYWLLTGEFVTTQGKIFSASARLEKTNEEKIAGIVERGRKSRWQVVTVETTEIKRAPRAPFTTSTLQQAASSRLGLSPSQTMRLAQHLYEAGHITYMRTDSTTLSQQALQEIAQTVRQKFGESYLQTRQYQTKIKNVQEAHEAIRPTAIGVSETGTTAPEKKLYRLIWTRALSSQMAEARLLKGKITVRPEDKEVPELEATGTRVTFDGWLRADPDARGEEVELPPVQTGEALALKTLESLAKETEPPRRYSEAGLVRELERRGIGRPSTYAPIIKTLFDRHYTVKENRSLRPTETGEAVSGFLEEHFAHYLSDDFTKEMEDKLDDMALGKLAYVKMLKDFYGPFAKAVAAKKNVPKISHLGEAPARFHCPVCGGKMLIKLGKNGRFLSCARFPVCDGALAIDGKKIAGPKDTGRLCPQCQTGKLVEREGRYGKFITCANYPKCKYVERNANTGADTQVGCPACKKGTMVEKRGRYGVFYGCSNYPECKNIAKTKPTGKLCDLCGSLMVEGTKTIPKRCSNKNCANHKPLRIKS